MAQGGVGNAWLNVIPRVDDAKAKAAGTQAGNSISSGLNTAISAKAVAIGNVIAGAVQTGMSAVGGEISKTFTNYMDFEQLSDGAKKIFDEIDYSKIQQDASDAYHDLNMSANEYLESINDVGAAFAATMGDQKGYDTAREGMLAISDYASGTGKNLDILNEKFMMISRSTGSYQSIADQFSGILPATSEEFLKQAQAAGYLGEEYTKLTEVPIDEYQQAVASMLGKGVEALNLTGNTAAEASETLSGSFASVRSAWDNTLTAIGEGGNEIDMSTTVDNLVTSLGDAVSNSADRIGVIGQTIGQLVSEAIPTDFSEGFASTFDVQPFLDAADHLASAGDKIGAFFSENVTGNLEGFGAAFGAVATIVGNFATAISSVLDVIMPFVPAIIGAVVAVKGFAIITGIAGAISAFVGTLSAAFAMVQTFSGAIAVMVTALGGPVVIIPAVIGAIAAFLATNEGAREAIANAWDAIKTAIGDAINFITTTASAKWQEFTSTTAAVFSNIGTAISTTFSNIRGTVAGIISNIVSTVTSKFNALRAIVSGIWLAIKTAITRPIEAARATIKAAVDRIKAIFSGLRIDLPKPKVPHFIINGGQIPWGIGGKGTPPSIDIQMYAKGGYVDGASLFVAGEKGGELIWPSYSPYLDRYAEAIASKMDGSAGGVNVYLTYNGSGDANELVSTLTRDLRMMRMTGAI